MITNQGRRNVVRITAECFSVDQLNTVNMDSRPDLDLDLDLDIDFSKYLNCQPRLPILVVK